MQQNVLASICILKHQPTAKIRVKTLFPDEDIREYITKSEIGIYRLNVVRGSSVEDLYNKLSVCMDYDDVRTFLSGLALIAIREAKEQYAKYPREHTSHHKLSITFTFPSTKFGDLYKKLLDTYPGDKSIAIMTLQIISQIFLAIVKGSYEVLFVSSVSVAKGADQKTYYGYIYPN